MVRTRSDVAMDRFATASARSESAPLRPSRPYTGDLCNLFIFDWESGRGGELLLRVRHWLWFELITGRGSQLETAVH